MEAFGIINIPEPPVGYLIHEPTHSQISVYEKINWFQKFFIKICFGLKYVKYK